MALSVFRPRKLLTTLTDESTERCQERAKKLAAAPVMPSVSDAVSSEDVIVDALSILEDACAVLLNLRNRIKCLAEPVLAASAEPDAATRALFADEYDERREELVEQTVGPQDAAYALLGDGTEQVEIMLSSVFSYRVSKTRILQRDGGIDLPAPLNAFESTEDILSTLRAIQNALDMIDRTLLRYRQDKKFLEGKLDSQRQSVVA